MKYIKYLIIALTGILAAACAEEDPYEVGAIDVTVTASQVTSTTATINVDLTKCAELFSDEAFNVDAYGSRYDQYCYVSLFEYTDWGRTENFVIRSTEFPSIINLTGKVTFKNLQPSTTYTFCVIITSPIGGVAYRRDDFTFTTTKEGDYSALADISPYEVTVGDQLAIINFKTPISFDRYSSTITVSKNRDMSDPLTASDSRAAEEFQGVELSSDRDYYMDVAEYTLAFKGLSPNTTYYWTIKGDVNVDGTSVSGFTSDVYTFTTTDKPDAITANVISSIIAGINRHSDYCSLDSHFNFTNDDLNCDGYIGLYTLPDEISLNSYLEYSKDYSLYMRLSSSGKYNGHFVDFHDFNYNSVLRTPDKQ